MKRILLLGSTGQVGYELARSLGPLAQVIAPSRKDFDLLMADNEIAEKIRQFKPDLLINAAAYTSVDKAEQETALAWQINAKAPAVMADVCVSLDIPMIHFSTDYVFDGNTQVAWTETDKVSPLNVYGQSKLAGEQAIRNSHAKHSIFRTSWVYGLHGNNFLNTMRRLAQERTSLNIVNDQIGSPTWSRHIAEAVSSIVAIALHEGDSFWHKHSGTYHMTNAGFTSWFEFAKAIFDGMKTAGQSVPKINAVSSDAYPVAAKRPLFSVLNNSLLESRFGIQLPNWRHTLSLVMQDMKS